MNEEKKGIVGYVGANTLLEMGMAFWQRKPVYLLWEVTDLDEDGVLV